jgi:hypothetical protein
MTKIRERFLKERTMAENSTNSTYTAINQLANLYVRAFYAYSWVRDIFQQDPLLQNLTTEFIQKTEDAKNCCQKILDFLFENEIHFLLMESSGKLDTDLSNVFSMKKEIKKSLSNALREAEKEGDEKSRRFLESLSQKKEKPSDNDVRMTSSSNANDSDNQLQLSKDSNMNISAANSPNSDDDSISDTQRKDDQVNDTLSRSPTSNSPIKEKPKASEAVDDSIVETLMKDDETNNPLSGSDSPDKKKPNASKSIDDSNVDTHTDDNQPDYVTTTPLSVTSMSSTCNSPTLETPKFPNSVNSSTHESTVDDQVNDTPLSEDIPDAEMSQSDQNSKPENSEVDTLQNMSSGSERSTSRVQSDQDALEDSLKAPGNPKYKIRPTNKTSLELETEAQKEKTRQPQNGREVKKFPKSILVVYNPEFRPLCVQDIVFWLHQTYPEIKIYITR